MGSNHSSQLSVQQHPINTIQLQKQIKSLIKHKRLHFSHQSNIYIKFQHLIKNFSLYQIQQLLLDHNMISEKVMELLVKIDVKNAKIPLKVICLSYNQLKCPSLKPILNCHLIHLTTLYLDHNNISNDGCYYLTKPKLQSLQTLDLTANLIQEQGARHLAYSNWPELKTLLISENKINVKGFLFLSKGEWTQLIFIQAKDNGFQVTKKLEMTQFRSQVKGFRIELE